VVWSLVYVALSPFFSWSCCWVDRSGRRIWRFFCSDTSWRFCIGSSGERGSGPSIERSSPRSPGRCREAPGRVCRCVRRPCCAGTASWSGGAGPIRTGAAAARSPRTGACSSTCTREPRLGLPADRRRAAEPRHLPVGDVGADDAPPPWPSARAATGRAVVANGPPRGRDTKVEVSSRAGASSPAHPGR
jgi:hypothetical protein